MSSGQLPTTLSSVLLLLQLLLQLPCPSVALEKVSIQACPKGFNSSQGRCLLINVTANVNWCDANRACANLGAELLTNWTVIQNLSYIFPNANAWIGASDISNERNTIIDGWKFVNGRGIVPNNTSSWIIGDPSNVGGNQDCVMLSYKPGPPIEHAMIDKQCNYANGYICELPDVTPTVTCGSGGGRIRWVPAPSPTPGVFNEANMYCYLERSNVPSLRDCAMLAGLRTYSRSFLYNKDLSACHVIEFSDSQTMLEQTPTSWVKFVRV